MIKRSAVLVAALSVAVGTLLTLPALSADPTPNTTPGSVADYQATNQDDMEIAALIADAGPGGHHKMHMTDDQLEKMMSLSQAYSTATAAKKAQLHVLHQQMRSALSAPSIDRGALASLNDKINSLSADLSRTRLNYMEDRAEVMTAEQRAAMHHMFLVMGAMHHHHGRGHHGGGCGGGHGHGGGGWGGHHKEGGKSEAPSPERTSEGDEPMQSGTSS
jgi:Spy/CpxP family protein refolding chaperone